MDHHVDHMILSPGFQTRATLPLGGRGRIDSNHTNITRCVLRILEEVGSLEVSHRPVVTSSTGGDLCVMLLDFP